MKSITPFVRILFLLFLLLSSRSSFSSCAGDLPEGIRVPSVLIGSLDIVLLQPADSTIDGLPVLRVIPPDDPIARVVYPLFEDSYMRTSVELYYLAQHFMHPAGMKVSPEPAYLCLSQNQGGFPRLGFYLERDGGIVSKSDVPYIELVKNDPGPEDDLGSMTQIYPHEMGHVIYRLLSDEADTILPGGVDIHYSTLTTDYGTAFNEGFAMHFENMARLFDPDESRRMSIIDDLERQKEKVLRRLEPFERDFTWPLRFGFYRLTMLLWYQQFEDIKRFEWVRDNRMKYMNASIHFNDAEKSLYYRNAGIKVTGEPRPVQQALATEGVIASFFAGLMQSEAKNTFRSPEFYLQFIPDLDTSDGTWTNRISPIINQYMKVFETLRTSVNRTLSKRSQFLDFVDGYIALNPTENDIVVRTVTESSGLAYPVDPGKELWITNPEHRHGILVMDQTGGIAVPYYTFNLNAATEADLLTFKALRRDDAVKIIAFIKDSGPLDDYSAVSGIAGVSPDAADLLINNRFDAGFFENFEDDGLSLSLNSLIKSYLGHFAVMGLAYGLVAVAVGFLLCSVLSCRLSAKYLLSLSLRFLLFLLAATSAVVLAPQPAIYFLVMSLLILAIGFFVFRKRRRKRTFIWSSLPLILVLIYALI